MKSPVGLVLVLLMVLTACTSQPGRVTNSAPNDQKVVLNDSLTPKTDTQAAQTYTNQPEQQKGFNQLPAEFKPVSLSEADTAAAAAEAADRKIIRNANLTMEVDSTTDAQHKVTSIAESHGGFVVTSEAKQREAADPAKRTLDIKLVVRIPATHFGPALDSIRGLANSLREENVTGQDVTEEFIDLEARVRTQKALELQFLDIMKQARKVEDALEVQRQIAEVRTEIEKLEGRKRFLENRASLSTITINLEGPKQIAVNTTGFGRSLRNAVSESIDVGSEILLFLVRFAIVMVPITIFVLLPLGLIFRYFVRRAKRMELAEALSNPAGD